LPKITFGGMASGLPANIVDQLIEAERIPIKNIETKKGKEENRLKLVSELETKLTAITGTIGALASTKGFSDMKITSGDPNVIQGVVDPTKAMNGNWNVEVMELAQKAAAITNGLPDKDKTQIGVGYFRFNTPDGRKEVYINGSNNTLDGVANAINAANVGVKATIFNDRKHPDAPFKLMISGTGVGGDNKVEYPTLYFLDGDQDLYFEDQREAKNGVVKVDGFEFEVGDNKVDDIIPGVSLELKQAAPGRTVSVGVKENQEVVSGKVKGFVDATNEVLKFIQAQNQLGKDTDTSQTLGGDGLLRSIEQRIRSLIQNPQYGVGGDINRLNQLGITFNRSGTLELKEEQFNTALMKNPGGVQRFLAGDGFKTGFISSLKRDISTMLDQAYGPIAQRKRGLQEKIRQMDQNIERKERQLTIKEETLRRKFAALEETSSRLKSQGASLGGMGGGGGGGGQGG
jgi:flagellar hook-associated protein 2